MKTQPKTIRILINQSSGGDEDKAKDIARLFERHRLTPEILQLTRAVDLHALARRPDTILVAAGGDGTVNCVAAAIAGTETSMGVLPTGTLNHFARDLGIPQELPAAIELLARDPSPKRVDAAEVNGRLFVNNSSLGFYPALVAQRDYLQKKSKVKKWLLTGYLLVRALLRFRQLRLEITVDGQKSLYRTPFLFVGNNEYCMQGLDPGSRGSMDRGCLFLCLAPGITRFGALLLAWAVLRGRALQVPNYKQFCGVEFTVGLHRRRVHVALDGEIHKLQPPLHYRIRPGALNVIAPESASEAQTA